MNKISAILTEDIATRISSELAEQQLSLLFDKRCLGKKVNGRWQQFKFCFRG